MSANDIPVSVSYDEKLPSVSRPERAKLLTATFAKVAPILQRHNAVIDLQEISVSGQSAGGHMPPAEFDALAAELQKNKFTLRRDDPMQMT